MDACIPGCTHNPKINTLISSKCIAKTSSWGSAGFRLTWLSSMHVQTCRIHIIQKNWQNKHMFGNLYKTLPKACKETRPPPFSLRPITPTQIFIMPSASTLSVPQEEDNNATPRPGTSVTLTTVPPSSSTRSAHQLSEGLAWRPSARANRYAGHLKPAQINHQSSFYFCHCQLTCDISLFSVRFPHARALEQQRPPSQVIPHG